MNRQIRESLSLGLCVLTLISGCKPAQPFFFAEDGNIFGKGDLSHYRNVATDIEYPDVNSLPIEEVTGAQAPLTLSNSENFEVWDLTLEEITRLTLTNSKVVRQLGGRISDSGSNIALSTPESLQQGSANAITTFDPALVESGNGTGTGSPFSGTGVESALAEFDAQLDATATWSKNDRPQNFGVMGLGDFFAPQFAQDLNNYSVGLTKNTANGSTFGMRHNIFYDFNNNGSRITAGDFFTNLEATFNQPLLQGAGTQYNRIAGFSSFQQAAGGVNQQIDGVLISRIRYDIALADFEEGIRNLMRDVEDAYWELYFAYRDLDARKIGRDSALETWLKVKALKGVGTQGGEADKEAQARSQYFLFRAQAEAALTNLFRVENRLRYMMGLAATDGRLIRPIDEPTTAKIDFDWVTIHCEALSRRTEIRNQKWQIKRRELELIATKNNLLPRLDASGTYRFLGAGEDLLRSEPNGVNPFNPGSNAYESLSTGDYQEWQVGMQFTMPIGFRRALAGVRHHQLLLAREKAVLEDLELEVSHQLTDAIRDIDFNFLNLQTNFNRRVASQDEVDAVKTVYDSGRVPIDLLLDAQRRRAEAESAYFRSLVDYNRAIMRAHYRKGSLLEYNGVYLAEGPWPGKAYFDALRRARHRDASTMINYGTTRPNVFSQGPVGQRTGLSEVGGGLSSEFIPSPTPAILPNENTRETLPLPDAVDPTSGETSTGNSGIDLTSFPETENIFSTGYSPVISESTTTPITPVGYAVAEESPITPANQLRQPATASTGDNPFRSSPQQEIVFSSDTLPQELSPATAGTNPLRELSADLGSPSTRLRPLGPSNESQPYHSTTETSANTAGWPR